MKKFFNNSLPAHLRGKSESDIVEEIHAAFDKEVDVLLAEANIKKPIVVVEEKLISKSSMLQKLGFKSASSVKEVEKIKVEALRSAEENRKKDELIATIRYFQMKYPNYKFITEESVRKICEKYLLIYGDVEHYIGDVPEKNIQDMLNFKMDEKDKCYSINRFFGGNEYCSYDDFKREGRSDDREMMDFLSQRITMLQRGLLGMSRMGDSNRACPFIIAAPQKDFDVRNMELDGFELKEKINIPDPVVLQPVFHNGKRHFLVVTAWGPEASDSLVVNEKMN